MITNIILLFGKKKEEGYTVLVPNTRIYIGCRPIALELYAFCKSMGYDVQLLQGEAEERDGDEEARAEAILQQFQQTQQSVN